MSQIHILLAEDDATCRTALEILLETEGYAVRAVPDGAAALAAYREQKPDLLLLDVMMPKLNGYAVCAEIRKRDPATAILFLTAKESEGDVTRGLNLGADDFLPKTVSEPILLARLASALRRSRVMEEKDKGGFAFGPLAVDGISCHAQGPGVDVFLTLRETEILRVLARHPGEIVSRDYLITHFWRGELAGEDHALTMAIRRLRDKLGPAGTAIRTVHAAGYRFEWKQDE